MLEATPGTVVGNFVSHVADFSATPETIFFVVVVGKNDALEADGSSWLRILSYLKGKTIEDFPKCSLPSSDAAGNETRILVKFLFIVGVCVSYYFAEYAVTVVDASLVLSTR